MGSQRQPHLRTANGALLAPAARRGGHPSLPQAGGGGGVIIVCQLPHQVCGGSVNTH